MHPIQRALQEGRSWTEIVQQTSYSRSTVAYHASKLRKGRVSLYARRHNWFEINTFLQSSSIEECEIQFSISRRSLFDATRKGLLTAKILLDRLKPKYGLEALTENSEVPRRFIRLVIQRYQLLPYQCAKCGLLPFWNNEPLVLILDHRNGINNDHRIHNLRWVCPNCNSQLPTFSGRNINRQNRPLIE